MGILLKTFSNNTAASEGDFKNLNLTKETDIKKGENKFKMHFLFFK